MSLEDRKSQRVLLNNSRPFISEEKNSCEMGMIINKGYKPTFAQRGGNTRGTPNITMNKGEGLTAEKVYKVEMER